MTLAVMSFKYDGKGFDDGFATHLAKAITAIRRGNLNRAKELVGDNDEEDTVAKGIVKVLKAMIDAEDTIGFFIFREGMFEQAAYTHEEFGIRTVGTDILANMIMGRLDLGNVCIEISSWPTSRSGQ